MKGSFLLIVFSFFLILKIYCQAPGKFNYQAIARNTNGDLIINQQISVRISILTESPNGTTEYCETHSITTDAFGVFNILIGGGNVISGSFNAITWGTANKFLKIEADVTGGTNYHALATTQILSVPYALYANKAGNGFSGDYNDLINKPILSISNDTVKLTGGSFGVLPKTFNDNEFKIVYAGGIAENPSTAPVATLAGMGAGNVDNGTHDYCVTFITSSGETGAGPASNSIIVSDNMTNGKIIISNIPVSGKTNVIARNIYRRYKSIGEYKLVTTINDNSTTTYIDNIPNSALSKTIPTSNFTSNTFQFDASNLTQNQQIKIPDHSGTLMLEELYPKIMFIYKGDEFNTSVNNGEITNSYEFPLITPENLINRNYLLISITFSSYSYFNNFNNYNNHASSDITVYTKNLNGNFIQDFKSGPLSNADWFQTSSGIGGISAPWVNSSTISYPHVLTPLEKEEGIIIKIVGHSYAVTGCHSELTNIITFIY